MTDSSSPFSRRRWGGKRQKMIENEERKKSGRNLFIHQFKRMKDLIHYTDDWADLHDSEPTGF